MRRKIMEPDSGAVAAVLILGRKGFFTLFVITLRMRF